MKVLSKYREAFLEDDDLLTHVMVGDSWRPHHVLAMAALGECLTEDEHDIFKKFTGGRDYKPGQRAKEWHTVGGRRTGKTVSKAAFATYLGTCIDYRDVLTRGETGVLLCLAQTQSVANQILNYVEENLLGSKILKQKFVGRTAEGIELTGHVRIEVRPASFRKLRGPTFIGICADELGFWYSEDYYANTDVEVLNAARQGMLTTRGMVVTISSPYAKRGVLWNAYKKHFGPDGSPLVLVAKGTTRDFNPLIDQADIDLELERDPERNRAELLASFAATSIRLSASKWSNPVLATTTKSRHRTGGPISCLSTAPVTGKIVSAAPLRTRSATRSSSMLFANGGRLLASTAWSMRSLPWLRAIVSPRPRRPLRWRRDRGHVSQALATL